MSKKYTTEDLRGMLDTYSPEQQMEIDAKTVSESAKALADSSLLIKECVEILPPLVAAMQNATTLHISEESVEEVMKAGENVGVKAAEAFKKSVESTILDAQNTVNHVTLPTSVALILLILLIGLILFSGIIIYLNCTLWHNERIYNIIWISVEFLIGAMALVVFMKHMKWI
jgi:TRAP-type mannitol/chloroaromatic compound transport system permease large subunit